jgi:hypothetical protein
MANDRRKKRKDDERRERWRQLLRGRRRAPPLSWPGRGKPVEAYTDGELYAVALHPMVTGLGSHPRTVSDEDWVASALRLIKDYGLKRLIHDLLHLLRMTTHFWLGQRGAAGTVSAYPQKRTDLQLPLPDAETSSPTGRWTPGLVKGALLNPVYTGLGPFPALVDEETWVAACLKTMEREGVKQTLVNILFLLKETFGWPGGPFGSVPFGYALPEEGAEE